MEYNGLTFEKFCEYLQTVDDLMELNDGIYHHIARYNEKHNDFGEFYMPNSASDIVDLLALILEDDGDWISYWVYDKDCGRLCHVDDVTDEHGNSIPFKTYEDVWNFLAQCRQERRQEAEDETDE